MRVIDKIISNENMDDAIRKVKSNKGISGVDKMTVDEIDKYFNKHREKVFDLYFTKLFSVANSRLGRCKCANGSVTNFLLNPDILNIRKGNQ